MVKRWTGDRPELYEACDWQDLSAQSDVRQKNRVLAALLPEDVTSVLDVGCGSGLFMDTLPAEWRVVGVDRAEAALSHAGREVVRASVTDLPFVDGEFEYAICSEVLEHLDDSALGAAVSELRRVASRGVIITVPSREDLWAATTRCRACGTIHNIHGHVQSFSRRRLTALFDDWGTATAYGELGSPAPQTPVLVNVARAYFGRETDSIEGSVCPSCGTRQLPSEPRLVDRVHGRLHRNAAKRRHVRPYWMLLMIDRQDVQS